MDRCPTCGQEITNPNLDEDGYPQVGQTWVISKEEFPNPGTFPTVYPEQHLRIHEVLKGAPRGREIRGFMITPRKGKEGNIERPYATDIETFNKIWGRKGHVKQEQGPTVAETSPRDTRPLKEFVEEKKAEARPSQEVDLSGKNSEV